ncbi:regulator of chromosome condensation domain-containing protein [Cavenderia fasciculata]|uniref:Regulator of chromosome condensation domain-containing protein n=1 Tax=Cavenderia fasciculata TaxID=261658 RepID=F4PUY2_CACFS|nr:regulator of chromosome condensation domain-containing protein [Cavenderia fasciculata]EGG21944.1 regulator of chromosome condensation domain-containing protein [Cavenderia fasciculata]|eukprot:XP_004359795.1 regulator of chromosome condensation domain-containing protein [Cavenderia fasciculata]
MSCDAAVCLRYFVSLNANGQLGTNLFEGSDELVYDQDNCTADLTLLKQFSNIKCISMGTLHSGLVTVDGGLWTFGNGSFGKLGLGNTDNYKIPMQVRPGVQFSMVSCGNEHTLALDGTGRVFSWGNGSKGRLGLGNESTMVTPCILPFSGVVLNVYAGGASSAAVTASNVYTWGYNKYGQLGLGNTKDGNRPNIISQFGGERIGSTRIACFSIGDRHMGAVDDEGYMYTWGCNEDYQLGDGGSFDKSVPYKHVKIRQRMKSIECGGKFTLSLSNEDDDHSLYIWGDFGEYTSPIPKKVDTGYESVSASCDCSLSFIGIKMNGETVSCGWSRYGQVGHLAEVVPLGRMTQVVGKPTAVSCGAYHSALLYKSTTDVSCQLVRSGNPNVAHPIINANIAQINQFTNYDGDTFLHLVGKMRVADSITIPSQILQHQINIPNRDGYPPFFYDGNLLARPATPNIKFIDSKNGQNVFHYYCDNKMFEDIPKILNLGIDERIIDKNGKRALDYLSVEDAFKLKKQYNKYDIAFVFDSAFVHLARKLRDSLEENHITVAFMENGAGNPPVIGYVFFVSAQTIKHQATTALVKGPLSKALMICIWAEKVSITDPTLESCIYRSQLVDFSTSNIYQLSLSTLLEGMQTILDASIFSGSGAGGEGDEDLKSDQPSIGALQGKEASIFLSFNPSKIAEYKDLIVTNQSSPSTMTKILVSTKHHDTPLPTVPSFIMTTKVSINSYHPLT